jgi:excisionase family DNA binding protein
MNDHLGFGIAPFGGILPSEGKLLTPSQVAKQLNVSPSLIYAEIKRGKLKARRFGKALRINELALKNYLDYCE